MLEERATHISGAGLDKEQQNSEPPTEIAK